MSKIRCREICGDKIKMNPNMMLVFLFKFHISFLELKFEVHFTVSVEAGREYLICRSIY